MSGIKSLRLVRCILCNSKVVESRAVRAGAGRNGSVQVWLCKACSEKPETGVARRKE